MSLGRTGMEVPGSQEPGMPRPRGQVWDLPTSALLSARTDLLPDARLPVCTRRWLCKGPAVWGTTLVAGTHRTHSSVGLAISPCSPQSWGRWYLH